MAREISTSREAVRRTLLMAAAVVLSGMHAGCVVPQPKGHGTVTRRTEPQTEASYWLYLPEDYSASSGRRQDGRRWPLVVTFHGMRPWDDAGPQIREWQQEADRYGFIVIAPELQTCDSFMQYPLKDPDLPYVQRDEKATLAIMDEVFRETRADPARVLATSWSSGGYMAHFMVNRHPERFSCLAVRQSNFSETMLNPAQVARYRQMRIGIFFGENDFKVCREESTRAVEWYRQYRFPVQAKYVSGLGHERTPQTAAAFFAMSIGVCPKTPPDLGQMVMYDIPADDVPGSLRRPMERRNREGEAPSGPGVSASGDRGRDSSSVLFNNPTADAAAAGPKAPVRVAPSGPVSRAPVPARTPPSQVPTPRRPIRQPYSETEAPAPRTPPRDRTLVPPIREQIHEPPIPGRIRIDGDTVGPAPLELNMRLEIPEQISEGASIVWMDNRRVLARSLEARSILAEPGPHAIEARVTTADDRVLTFTQTITVLAPPTTSPSS